MKLEYETCCVNSDAQSIHDMVDYALNITWATFRKHVCWQSVRDVFPFYSYHREKRNSVTGELVCGFHIKDDYAVSFHRSRYQGKRCYYIRHSSIEYIWI